jgi:hypothetical protein
MLKKQGSILFVHPECIIKLAKKCTSYNSPTRSLQHLHIVNSSNLTQIKFQVFFHSDNCSGPIFWVRVFGTNKFKFTLHCSQIYLLHTFTLTRKPFFFWTCAILECVLLLIEVKMNIEKKKHSFHRVAFPCCSFRDNLLFRNKTIWKKKINDRGTN